MTCKTSPSGDALKDLKTLASSVANNSSSETRLPFGGQRILNINVGADDKLTFSPSDAKDQLPGTIVQFYFFPKVNSGTHEYSSS
jgi:hypothetical protein